MARKLNGIIMDVETRQYIEFFSWEPPQKQRPPVYDDVVVRGRTEPHTFYSHTEARVWSWTIHFVASIDQGDRGLPQAVKEKENFVESLVLPDFGIEPGELSVVKPPHLARIRIKRLIDAVGTIRSPTFNEVGPFDVDTGYPYQIDVSFSFHEQRMIGASIDSMTTVRRLLAYGQTRQG